MLPITGLAMLGPQGAIRPPSVLLAGLLVPFVLAEAATRRALWHDVGARSLALATAVLVVGGGIALVYWPPEPLPGKPGPVELYLKAIMALGMGLGFYVVARDRLRGTQDICTALPWITLGIASNAAIALGQVLLSADSEDGLAKATMQALTAPFTGYPWGKDGRGPGLSGEPSYHASLLVLLLPLALGALMWARSAVLPLLVIGIAVFGAVVSGSRFGMLSVAVVALAGVLAFVAIGRGRMALLLLAVVLPCMVVGWMVMRGNAYVERLLTLQPMPTVAVKASSVGSWSQLARAIADPACDSTLDWPGPRSAASVASRCGTIAGCLRLVAGRPVLGCGFGLSPTHLAQVLPVWVDKTKDAVAWKSPADRRLPTPMNMPLRLLAEAGVVGLAVALLVIAVHWPRHITPIPIASLGLLALMLDGLSMATFALPGIWLVLAAWRAGAVDHSEDHG